MGAERNAGEAMDWERDTARVANRWVYVERKSARRWYCFFFAEGTSRGDDGVEWQEEEKRESSSKSRSRSCEELENGLRSLVITVQVKWVAWRG